MFIPIHQTDPIVTSLNFLKLTFPHTYILVSPSFDHSTHSRDPRSSIPTLILGCGADTEDLSADLRARHPHIHLKGIACAAYSHERPEQNFFAKLPILSDLKNVPHCIRTHHIRLVLITLHHIERDLFETLIDETIPGSVLWKIIPQTFKKNPIPLTYSTIPLTYSKMLPLQAEDLIGRRSLPLDHVLLEEMLAHKTILVTGAGGSIGSELVKTILTYPIKKIIALTRSEHSLYRLKDSLEAEFPEQNIATKIDFCIGNAKDYPRLVEIAVNHPLDIILHAAAHKYVTLMETHEKEAIKNNVFTTYHLLRLVKAFKIRGFVFVSTDKAVTPKSMMGASKKFAEELIHEARAALHIEHPFASAVVRLGNVIGSRGSVIPLFNKQIRSGGPITVTHPKTRRYFMTVREASFLIVTIAAFMLKKQAAGSATQTYLLSMGPPIGIDALVRRIIRLHGYVPEEDMEISYIGMRSGEKIDEILYDASATVVQTSNPNILKISDPPIPGQRRKIWHALNELMAKLDQSSPHELRKQLRALALLEDNEKNNPQKLSKD